MIALALPVAGFRMALSEELRCSVCGTPIPDQTKYYRARGTQQVFCERCFANAPRCSLCKSPTAPANIDRDTGACPQCLAKLPRCRICGKPIAGAAYAFPFAKGIFCPECRNSRPACYTCGVPVGNDYWRYPDGRIVCGECGERAVFDIDAIRRIMRDAEGTVRRRLGLVVKQPYFVTVERLSGMSATGSDERVQTPSGRSPLYGKELGMYRRSGDRSEIFLLFGLPPELLYEAAAHEYAHAWQAENCPADLSPDLREGFAQWVAAEVLRVKSYRSALEKLEARRDSPYGTGYQYVKRLSQRIVLDRMLHGQ